MIQSKKYRSENKSEFWSKKKIGSKIKKSNDLLIQWFWSFADPWPQLWTLKFTFKANSPLWKLYHNSEILCPVLIDQTILENTVGGNFWIVNTDLKSGFWCTIFRSQHKSSIWIFIIFMILRAFKTVCLICFWVFLLINQIIYSSFLFRLNHGQKHVFNAEIQSKPGSDLGFANGFFGEPKNFDK